MISNCLRLQLLTGRYGDSNKMRIKKLILRRESFGGIFVDTGLGKKRKVLRPEEYESKRHELLKAQIRGENIKIFDATQSGYSLLQDAFSSPESITFELTKRCNGSCCYCFTNSNSYRYNCPEISFLEIRDIIKRLSDLGGYRISLSGGEPTMREDFFDIIDLINEEGFTMRMNTNGLYGEETLEGILSRGVKDIRISLDGPEEINDKIRTKGSYQRIIGNLRNIAEYNKTANEPVDVTINVVLMKPTKDYIEEMVELAHDLGFKISFGLMRLTGRARKEDMLSPEEMVRASYRVQKMRERLGLRKGSVRINYDIFRNVDELDTDKCKPLLFDKSSCHIGVTGIILDAFGRIVPCGYFVNEDKWIGEDVRGKDLLELWYNSDILKEARRTKRLYCKGCEYYMVMCNGGCPAMSYFVNKNINGKDPYCVRNVNILEALRGLKEEIE